MNEAKMKKPIRSISSRELHRRVADLLDEIEDEGHSILIVRYGRPSAILTAVPGIDFGKRLRQKRRAGGDDRINELVDQNPEEELLDVELDNAQRHVLLHFDDRSYDDGTLTAKEMPIARARLEMAGLLTRSEHGFLVLSRAGRRLAETLAHRES